MKKKASEFKLQIPRVTLTKAERHYLTEWYDSLKFLPANRVEGLEIYFEYWYADNICVDAARILDWAEDQLREAIDDAEVVDDDSLDGDFAEWNGQRYDEYKCTEDLLGDIHYFIIEELKDACDDWTEEELVESGFWYIEEDEGD